MGGSQMTWMRLILLACVLAQVPDAALAKEFRTIRQTMSTGKMPEMWPYTRCAGMYAAISNFLARDGGAETKKMSDGFKQAAKIFRRAVANTKARNQGGSFQKYMPGVVAQANAARSDYLNRIEHNRVDQDRLMQEDLATCDKLRANLEF